MEQTLQEILLRYDESAPLAEAQTLPASWYTDARVAQLENQSVFARTWQPVARTDQLESAGQYVTATVAGEPIVVVRGADSRLRGFYNVCRHHAMIVMNEPCGHGQWVLGEGPTSD